MRWWKPKWLTEFLLDQVLEPRASHPPIAPVQADRRLLDEVCDWVRGGSRVDEQTLAAMTLAAEDARLIAEAFSGSDGEKRLMILARMTVLRPPVDVTLPVGSRDAYAQLRQGQDSIFAGVVRYLDIHKAQKRNEENERASSEPYAQPGAWDPGGLVAGR
ncbi:hypothetical protein [Brevundimonas vancanneytii]|uniref:Uncharacterized protein n=1 Tax=Brevundimonas vancanneytii TaxID=1325724 RepID=A0A4P1K3V4_9CAUL|nr:hypothetical protein [Brevundimonas vancanneytii]VTO14056.1 Uncharacterised protein [Brevundimonas vancanneytii]